MDPYFHEDFSLFPEHNTTQSNLDELRLLSQRIAQVKRALGFAEQRRNARDKLDQQLHHRENKTDDLFERRYKTKVCEAEDLSLQQRLKDFLEWRDQLEIFYTAVTWSLLLMKQQRVPRQEIKRLQEIKDETSMNLCHSDWLSLAAREKLHELSNENDFAANSHQRSKSRGNSSRNAQAVYYCNAKRSSAADKRMKLFDEILYDVEKIRVISQKTSLRMENEVERLKAEGRSLANEIVDLHKVLEGQKQQLVQVTRMKRENEKKQQSISVSLGCTNFCRLPW